MRILQLVLSNKHMAAHYAARLHSCLTCLAKKTKISVSDISLSAQRAGLIVHSSSPITSSTAFVMLSSPSGRVGELLQLPVKPLLRPSAP